MTAHQFIRTVEFLYPGTTDGIYPFASDSAAIKLIALRLNFDLTNLEGRLHKDILTMLIQHVESQKEEVA